MCQPSKRKSVSRKKCVLKPYPRKFAYAIGVDSKPIDVHAKKGHYFGVMVEVSGVMRGRYET